MWPYQTLGDDEHSERPKILTADDNIDQIRQIALNNRRTKVKETDRAMSIFREHVYLTLNEDLDMRELSARLLTSGQKHIQMNISNIDAV